MQPRAETAVLVVNWRSASEVLRLLDRLCEQPPRPTSLTVLDNASGEEQLRQVRDWATAHGVEVADAGCLWPRGMTLIASDTNLGYACGVNAMVESLVAGEPPRRFLFLNPDTTPCWNEIEEMHEVADESGAAIVGARVVSRDVVASEFIGERWPLILVAALPGVGRMRSGTGDRWWRSGRFDGAAALIDAAFVRDRWQRLGYFIDTALEMYWDEWDISLDARRRGYDVVTSSRAVVAHEQAAMEMSASRRRLRGYYMARNAFLVAKRSFPRAAYIAMALPMIVNALGMEVARAGIRRRRPPLRAALEGVADGLRGRTGRWRNHPG